MSAEISTLENASLFRYLGTDRLYTDHQGRRVVVDVEGSGIARLITCDPSVSLIRSGPEGPEFAKVFANGLIVLAEGSGEVSVQILKGRNEPVDGVTIEVCGFFKGCGWVVGAEAGFSVDERHEPAPPASNEFPVPFFRGVSGLGQLTVALAPDRVCVRSDGLSIADEAALKSHDFKVQNMSRISTLDSCFSDGTPMTASIASHLNAASFTMATPPDNDGLILRKTYDRFHGRQRARVFVDGQFAGWWYEPGEDRGSRWHVSDFGVGAALTAGKSLVRITVEPPAGVPLWSVSTVELFALRAHQPDFLIP